MQLELEEAQIEKDSEEYKEKQGYIKRLGSPMTPTSTWDESHRFLDYTGSTFSSQSFYGQCRNSVKQPQMTQQRSLKNDLGEVVSHLITVLAHINATRLHGYYFLVVTFDSCF